MVKISMYASSNYGSVDIEENCSRAELDLVLNDLLGSMKLAIRGLRTIKKEEELLDKLDK